MKKEIEDIEISLGEPKVNSNRKAGTKDVNIPMEIESLEPGTKVEVRYRVNSGEVQTVTARLVKKAEKHSRFTAKLPGLNVGDIVEYSAMPVRHEHELPTGEEFSNFEAFRITEKGFERLAASELESGLLARRPPTNRYTFQQRLKPVQLIFQPTSKDEPPVEENDSIELELGVEAFSDFVKERQLAVTQVHKSLTQIKTDLTKFFPTVRELFPETITGEILKPDGTPAERVSVEAQEPEYTSSENVANIAWPTPKAITDERGVFTLQMPRVPISAKGLTFRVRGRSNSTSIVLERSDFFGTGGRLGLLILDRELAPMPTSIVSQLKDIVPSGAEDSEDNPEDFAEQTPPMILGDETDCAQVFHSNSGVIDRHRYSIMFRLVDPLISQAQPTVRFPIQSDELKFMSLSLTTQRNSPAFERAINRALLANGKLRYVDRVPVSRPIDVTDFFTNIAENPDEVPKAASLGLGYVVKMHTTWAPKGLSLGDMLYALPLAPGEEQRVAIFEQEQQLAVRESERLGIADEQILSEVRDSSTEAVFQSALREAASGGSSFHTEAGSRGVGIAGGIGGFIGGLLFSAGAAASYGGSSSSGSSNSWQKGSRDFVSSATQDFHSILSRVARTRRQVNRSSVRLATASDREEITTKLIANHNHNHALTMQYWEVLRHFSVNTKVDDVQLVCFVPLDIVQFLPNGQPLTLPSVEITRDFLLHRYQMLILYNDALAHRLRRKRKYFHGLKLLRDFTANPAMGIETSSGLAEDIVEILVEGTFMPFEEVFISMYSDTGRRLGTTRLSPVGSVEDVPTGDDGFVSSEELLQYLNNRRLNEGGSTHERTGAIRLPRHISRSNVTRFELTRRFQSFTYRLKPQPLPGLLGSLGDSIIGNINDILNSQNRTVTLSPTNIEREIGGPMVTTIKADIKNEGGTSLITFVDDRTSERMGTRLLIPSRDIPPALSEADILHIESAFQHIVSNTVSYSKTIWQSLTPEERAILLERFTVGVPEGGIEDATQEVPLLNCVTNEVLGFYGNAMIMPFHIPPDVASQMEVTTRDVQEALLTFHREGFTQNRSTITLPTQGMLGETVLGNCNSSEKIDITRFWNWKDSPHDKAAPAETAPGFRGQSLIGSTGAQAASVLKPPQPVNLLNVNTADGSGEAKSLASSLIDKAITTGTFGDLTGKDKLAALQTETLKTAESARDKALSAAKGMAEKVIDKLPDVMKTKAGIDEKQEKKQEEIKEKQKKAKEKKKSDGIAKLKEGAKGFTLLAGSHHPDEEKATNEAKKIVNDIFGDELPGRSALATLLETFSIAEGDSDKVKLGKTTILKALGLPVPTS